MLYQTILDLTILLYYAVLYCTVLYCTVLRCTVLNITAFHWYITKLLNSHNFFITFLFPFFHFLGGRSKKYQNGCEGNGTTAERGTSVHFHYFPSFFIQHYISFVHYWCRFVTLFFRIKYFLCPLMSNDRKNWSGTRVLHMIINFNSHQ